MIEPHHYSQFPRTTVHDLCWVSIILLPVLRLEATLEETLALAGSNSNLHLDKV